MPRPVLPEGKWSDRHRLVSFYASTELIDLIEAEIKHSGQSKTQVIVAAVETVLEDRRRAAAVAPQTLPRARCAVCGADVAVRRNGALREHRRHPGDPKPCRGSGRQRNG